MAISESLLPEFDQEMAGVRRTLERVPEDKFDWKPHPKSLSLSVLAGHLANLPSWGTMKVACFRSFVINHMIHHRAQLGVYLRINDVPVPSLYGPSADEMPPGF